MFCQEFWQRLKPLDLSLEQTYDKNVTLKIKIFLSLMRNSNFQLLPSLPDKLDLLIQQYTNKDELPFNLIWSFKVGSNGNYVVQVSPYFVQLHGKVLRVDHRNRLLDCLRMIAAENFNNSNWIIFLHESNEIALKTILEEPNLFIHQFHKYREEASIIYKKLIKELNLYTLEPLVPTSSYSKHSRSSVASEEIHRRFVQMEMSYELRKKISELEGDKKSIFMNSKQICHQVLDKFQKQHESLGQKHSEVEKIMGIEPLMGAKHDIISNKLIWSEELMQQFLENGRDNKKRNVYGVRVLKTLKVEQPLDEQNCAIQKGRFEILYLHSIHALTNAPIEASQAIYGYDPDQFKKKKNLTVKTLKDKKVQTAKCFENEVKMLMYLRNHKGSHYLPTYFLQEKKEYDEKYSKIMMDFYSGPLGEFMEVVDPPMAKKLQIFFKLVKGLLWLNIKGICHRNVDPQNIMVDSSDEPKIIDFGSCCSNFEVQCEDGSFKHVSANLTRTNKYHPDFELYQELPIKKKYNKRQYNQHPLFDVYSVSKVMEELLEGQAGRLQTFGGMLRYVWGRCTSADPDRRLTCKELTFIMSRLVDMYSKIFTGKLTPY